jgi:Zn ribbon nucleic-acid-binding protein
MPCNVQNYSKFWGSRTDVAEKECVLLGYVLRGSDQRARASMRVQATGVFVSYVTATGQ